MSTTNENTLWEEKNSIEPKKNCLNNNATELNDIINDTSNVSTKNPCNDTGKISGIYKIVNKVNGKYYVGSSRDVLKCRFYEHKRLLTKNKHFNKHLQNSWNVYGESNFEFVLVESCNDDRFSLLKCEQKYLDIAKNYKTDCYNMTFTAGRVDWTPELKNLISKLHKGNNYRKNSVMVKLSDDIIANLKKIWILSGKDKMIEEAKHFGIGGRVSWSLIKLYGEDKSARLLRKQNHRLSIKASIINKDVKLKPNYDHKMYNFLNIQNKSIFEGTKNDFFKTHGFYASSDLFNGKRKHYRGWKLI